jgi:chromosome segregation ATPase
MRQQTKWTPENIKKDPAGYLGWAIAQTDGTKDKLGSAQLALRTQLNQIDDRLSHNKTDVSNFEALIKDMLDEREKANTKNSWPVTVRGVKFETEQDLKEKAVEANGKLTRAKSLVETYSKAQTKVKDRLNEIDEQMTKVENLKTKLETDLETAKVQQTFEGIEGVSSNFDDIVHTSDALAQTAEKNASVNEMVKPSGEQRTNDEFDKLLKEHKGSGSK